MEILAVKIRTGNTIKGYTLTYATFSKEVKLSQYVDDVTIFLKVRQQIQITINIIENFGKVAGFFINNQKTKLLLLGIDKASYNHNMGLSIEANAIKCLGIYVGHNKSICEQKNWDIKIQKIENLLKLGIIWILQFSEKSV
jgi:hypothetical protein